MRISDWSSDVCSSDLLDRKQDRLAVRAGRELAYRLDIFLRDEIVDRLRIAAGDRVGHHLRRLGFGLGFAFARFGVAERGFAAALGLQDLALFLTLGAQDFRRAHAFGFEDVGALFALGLPLPRQYRKSVVSGKSVSVRVDLVCPRYLTKQKVKLHT